MNLNINEIVLIFAIFALNLYVLLKSFNSKFWIKAFQPQVFISLNILYYCVFGPLVILYSGRSFFRNLETSPYYIWGWIGTLVFYIPNLIGYYFLSPKYPSEFIKKKTINLKSMFNIGLILTIVSYLSFLIIRGRTALDYLSLFGSFNAVISSGFQQGYNFGELNNIFLEGVNILIPGIILMFISLCHSGKNKTFTYAIIYFTISLFISIGFRSRVIMLLIPCYFIYYFSKNRKPPVLLSTFYASILLTASSFIELTRVYFAGLDITKFNFDLNKLFVTAFMESNPFITSSVIFETIPRELPFIGTRPILETIVKFTHLIGLGEKFSDPYYTEIINMIYGAKDAEGAAHLGFAEYYLMGGWIGLIISGLLFGYFLKRLWIWFLSSPEDYMTQAIYFTSIGFLYMVFSRGFFPQIFTFYIFLIGPLLILNTIYQNKNNL